MMEVFQLANNKKSLTVKEEPAKVSKAAKAAAAAKEDAPKRGLLLIRRPSIPGRILGVVPKTNLPNYFQP